MSRAFNGTNQVLKTADGAVANMNDATLTYAAWVYKTAQPSAVELIFGASVSPTAANTRVALDCFTPTGTGTKFRFSVNGTGNGQWDTDNDFSLNRWYHVAVTYDSTDFANNDPIIYVDGVSEAFTETSTPSGTRAVGADTITIGERGGGGNDLTGRVAEPAIWNAILTAVDIRRLAIDRLRPIEVVRSSLQFYAPLIGQQSPEPEIIQAANLTVTGATQATHPPGNFGFDRRGSRREGAIGRLSRYAR